MNKGTFAKRLILPVLVGAFVAGCATQSSAPVRDSRPVPPTRATTKPLEAPPVLAVPIARPGEHIVQQGETLYGISRQYGVSVKELIAWNNLSRPQQLDVGQTLRVAPPVPGAIAAPLAPEPGMSLVEIKREPRGGKEAWSEEAWARIQSPGYVPPGNVSPGYTPPGQTPIATMSRPELSTTEPTVPGTTPGVTPGIAPPVSTTSGPTASESWMWPVRGAIIGRFDDPVGEDGKSRNRGIDIDGAPGTPILAAASGKVAYTGSAVRGYGNMVIIKHSDEYLTAYAHNRVILVKEGDSVQKGQKIAELGDSDTNRPKLHFEVRKQGVPVDPLKYLPGL